MVTAIEHTVNLARTSTPSAGVKCILSNKSTTFHRLLVFCPSYLSFRTSPLMVRLWLLVSECLTAETGSEVFQPQPHSKLIMTLAIFVSPPVLITFLYCSSGALTLWTLYRFTVIHAQSPSTGNRRWVSNLIIVPTHQSSR